MCIVLKTSDKNRRQAICASLIASTIVTADCADEGCGCSISQDSEDALNSFSSPGDTGHAEAELPLEGKVSYSLVPVVMPLLSGETMVAAELPSEMVVEELLADTISQADHAFELQGEADENVPRLTQRIRRSPSNQNRAGRRAIAEGTSTEVVILPAAPESQPGDASSTPAALTQQEQSPAQAPLLSDHPLLQDAYIAFGANGR